MKFLQDIRIGDKAALGSHTFTAEEIKTFAQAFDPQPFHVDIEFARKWSFGGLVASGLHTMCVTLKLWLEMGVLKASSLGSPGLGETQFPRPVRPGDTLRVITDIVELRASASKPDRGGALPVQGSGAGRPRHARRPLRAAGLRLALGALREAEPCRRAERLARLARRRAVRDRLGRRPRHDGPWRALVRRGARDQG